MEDRKEILNKMLKFEETINKPRVKERLIGNFEHTIDYLGLVFCEMMEQNPKLKNKILKEAEEP